MSAMTICGRDADQAGRFGRSTPGRLLARIAWAGAGWFGWGTWAGITAGQFVDSRITDADLAKAFPSAGYAALPDRLAADVPLSPLASTLSPSASPARYSSSASPASPASLISPAARLAAAASRLWLVVRAWDKTTKLLAGSAVGLIPWIVVLGLTLPSHTVARNWSTVWIGFDVLLATAFGVTARLYLRNDPRVGIMAAVVATLLIVDCWFDTSTAANGLDAVESWASAIFVEIPIAVFCARLAWRSSLAMVRVSPDRSPTEPSE